MDLSKVVLINFIDKVRVTESDPHLTIQRLIRYSQDNLEHFNDPSKGEGETPKSKRVLSITRRHWDIYDALVEKHDVCPSVLFNAVERYQKIKPCGFDQALEICLDMIWQTFNLSEMPSENDEMDEELTISDRDLSPSTTLH